MAGAGREIGAITVNSFVYPKPYETAVSEGCAYYIFGLDLVSKPP
jgi:hypothetical protein